MTWRLFFLLVLTACAVATPEERWRSLVSSLQQGGAILEADLVLTDFPDTGRGVASGEPLAPKSRLFQLPATLALSASGANLTVHGQAAWAACALQPRYRDLTSASYRTLAASSSF